MTPFVAPLDDILFSLHHVARAPLVEEWDHDFAAEVGKHFAAFAEGEIDFEILPDLDDGDLKDLGLPVGPRKKILKAIAALGASDAQAPAEAPGASQRSCPLGQSAHPWARTDRLAD